MGRRCMQRARRETGEKLAGLIERLREAPAGGDPAEERREIVRAAEVLETLAQELRDAADPNIE